MSLWEQPVAFEQSVAYRWDTRGEKRWQEGRLKDQGNNCLNLLVLPESEVYS